MILPNNALKFIEKTLYKVFKEEIKSRIIFPLDTTGDPLAETVGYNIYNVTGSAKIMAYPDAKDLPFVSDEMEEHTAKVYTIASGLKWTKTKLEKIAKAASAGRIANVSVLTEQARGARRTCYKKENILVFAGDNRYKIKGIFDGSYYGAGKGTRETVAATGTGSSTNWKDKTGKLIAEDIQKGITLTGGDGIFSDLTDKVTVVVPYAQYQLLKKPFTDSVTETVYSWLKSVYPNLTVEYSSCVSQSFTGDSVDYMLVFRKDPEILSLHTPQDILLGKPTSPDVMGTVKQSVTLRTAGLVVRHPGALYVGRGI